MIGCRSTQVVEEPYTVREARIHVRHVRDLLKSADNADAYAGVDCASLSFLNTVCHGDVNGVNSRSLGSLATFHFSLRSYLLTVCHFYLRLFNAIRCQFHFIIGSYFLVPYNRRALIPDSMPKFA